MNKIDLKSLEIKKLISSFVISNEYKKIDLIAIFFHELMIYATNFYIIKNSKEYYPQKKNFPFLYSEYIKKIPKLEFNENLKRKIKIKLKIIKFIQSFLPISNTISIEDSVDLKKQNFILRNFFKYKFETSSNTKIFVENKNEQLANLKILLKNIAFILDIKIKDNFILNFTEYVNSYVTQKPIIAQSDILIVGSNQRLLTRINSAIYLSQDKKVISIAHGEHSPYVLDEPGTGYGEMIYCNDYIDYGRQIDFEQLKYALPIKKLPKMHFRSSKVIRNYYRNNKIISDIHLKNNSKILYIPTLFSGNERYGPFRDIEDSLYKKWQDSIMNLNYNVTYKVHPKNKVDVENKFNKINKKNLNKVILDYDFYILDYISTASALCVATSKPIIYFNLGKRNLLKEAEELFKKRVFWVDINMSEDFTIQINQALKTFIEVEKKYINEYTEKFSLAEDNKSEIEVLEDILRKD